MEKIIVKPNEVRALGDIVSPKTSSDFLPYQSTISSGTDTDYGTVYTSGVLAGSYLTITDDRWITPSDSSFTVHAVLKNSSDTVITSARVYCTVNEDTVLSGTTNSSGKVAFTVPLVDNVCIYDLLFTYEGSLSVAGCFRGFRVYTGGDEWELDLIGEKSIIQTDETDILVARVTGENCNTEIVGVPGQVVYFFEEWTPNVRLSGTANIIQSGDTDVLTAQLIDNEDGSIVKESGHTVYFYEQGQTIIDDSTEQECTGGNTTVLFELPKLTDNWILSCKLKTNAEARIFIGNKSTATGNPNYSLFVGSPNGTNMAYYGDRDTSTHATDISSYDVTSYTTMSIERADDTFKFILNGTAYTKTVSWFDSYSDFVIGLVAWGSGKSVFVKDLTFDIFRS